MIIIIIIIIIIVVIIVIIIIIEFQQSMQLLKGLFKQLDPSVTSTVGDNNGQVQLSFKYDGTQNLLLVKVLKCRDLRNKDIRTKASDPYVKVICYMLKASLISESFISLVCFNTNFILCKLHPFRGFCVFCFKYH